MHQTQSTLACSVGIAAYNEEENIGRLLERLLHQKLSCCEIKEIIVLASGCTDNTEAIVRKFTSSDARINLVVQPCREGKASAINLFLRHAHSDILVIDSADTLPEPTTIQRLIEPFRDPEVGMTGAHPVPVNDPHTLMGFAAQALWELHHQIALHHPKMGELTAFRRIFYRIPKSSATDEASMEALIRGQGYRLCYVPGAIVHNRGPATVSDYLKQRRRISAGHLRLKHEQGYIVSTMRGGRILAEMPHLLRLGWRCMWIPCVVALEVYGRFLGWLDFHYKKRDHAVWDIAATTKRSIG